MTIDECYYHLRAKIRNISDVRKFMNTYFMFDEKKLQAGGRQREGE